MCTINKRAHTKKVWKLIWWSLYIDLFFTSINLFLSHNIFISTNLSLSTFSSLSNLRTVSHIKKITTCHYMPLLGGKTFINFCLDLYLSFSFSFFLGLLSLSLSFYPLWELYHIPSIFSNHPWPILLKKTLSLPIILSSHDIFVSNCRTRLSFSENGEKCLEYDCFPGLVKFFSSEKYVSLSIIS